MEAMSFWLPVILLKYELWKYIYPDKIITNNLQKKLREVIENYEQYSKLSIEFVKKFGKNKVLKILEKIICQKK